MSDYFAGVHARGFAPPPSEWCEPMLSTDADCDGLDDRDPTGVCTPTPGRLAEGDVCITDPECGLAVDGRRMQCVGCICTPRPGEGERCGPLDCDRAAGLECVDGPDGVARCQRATVVADGERCGADGVRCLLGSACTSEGRCARRPRFGEVCDPAWIECWNWWVPLDADLCQLDTDGRYRCMHARTSPTPPGEPCELGEMCAGGRGCPPARVCPTECPNLNCSPLEACDREANVCRPILSCTPNP